MKKTIGLLFTAMLLFSSCKDAVDDLKNQVEERQNFSIYGGEEMLLNNSFYGDGGAYDGYESFYLYLSQNSSEDFYTTGLQEGDAFLSIFFAHKTENLETGNYPELIDRSAANTDIVLEAAKFIYSYEPNKEGPNAILSNSGSVNIITFDPAADMIEFEYEFTFEGGKSIKGYYKGNSPFVGEVG